MSSSDLLVVAGEASGDLHAARLLRALTKRRPDLRAFGLGSDELRAAGAELLADSREISVVGIIEAFGVLARAREILALLMSAAERRRPAAAILVDFPDFNLRLASELRWLQIPVIYYVSPQVWAWRRGRVRAIAETVDRMLVLFGFELPFYVEHRVPAVHVGHPLVDEVPQLEQAWDRVLPGETPEVYELALLPGSRRSEIRVLLPIMVEATRRLGEHLPIRVTIVRAPSIDLDELESLLPDGSAANFRIVSEGRFEAVANAHLALCASGTATLETGLLRTPLVVLYRLEPWTWLLAKLLVRVPHASLVNLVLGMRAVPELLQTEASPERVAAEAQRLLESRRDIDRIRGALTELRGLLGLPGASDRAAAEVLDVLARRETAA